MEMPSFFNMLRAIKSPVCIFPDIDIKPIKDKASIIFDASLEEGFFNCTQKGSSENFFSKWVYRSESAMPSSEKLNIQDGEDIELHEFDMDALEMLIDGNREENYRYINSFSSKQQEMEEGMPLKKLKDIGNRGDNLLEASMNLIA